MRRTVQLAIEIDGAAPDAYELRDALVRMDVGSWRWAVVHAEVVDDGIGRRNSEVRASSLA